MPQTGSLWVGISIFSYAGLVNIGLITDRGLVSSPESIITAFQAEFESLLKLARLLAESGKGSGEPDARGGFHSNSN